MRAEFPKKYCSVGGGGGVTPFRNLQEKGFSDMYGLRGGGVGDHVFAEFTAEVGRFKDFGLSV